MRYTIPTRRERLAWWLRRNMTAENAILAAVLVVSAVIVGVLVSGWPQ